MNYAVIGTGYWGENHVRVGAELRDEGLVDDVIVCDIDEDRARSMAETYDLDYTTDHTNLIGEADAATVATPSPTHHGIAADLLPGGVDLLVEKPLALDAERAWGMVETADEHDRVLSVGHIFRYHPALRELKRRIDRGELGEILYLHTNRFAFRVPRETTGVLYSLAVHDVDVYNYLLGEGPERVGCHMDSYINEGIDETTTVTLDYGDDGATGIINSSWRIPVFGKSRHLVVVGTDRSAYIDYLENTELEIHNASMQVRDDQPSIRQEGSMVYEVESREPLKHEVEDFVRASVGGGDVRADGRIGARTVELLELARLADERGAMVETARDGAGWDD